jgi:hypothetical protein
MKLVLVVLALLSGSALSTAQAGTLSCPDLSAAVQAGACPSEEELRYTFNGYCSDDARAYETDSLICADFKNYRALKNTSFWESKDGAFQGYISCDTPAATIRAARASAISVVKKGSISRVICSYTDGITLTHRSKGACQVTDAANCATDPAACKARCD